MKNQFFSKKKAIFGTIQKPLRQKSSFYNAAIFWKFVLDSVLGCTWPSTVTCTWGKHQVLGMYLVLGGKYKLLGSNWYLKVSTSYLDSTWYLGVSTSYKKELVLKLQVTVLNTPLLIFDSESIGALPRMIWGHVLDFDITSKFSGSGQEFFVFIFVFKMYQRQMSFPFDATF